MRAQNLLNAGQPANAHRRVLAAVVWLFFSRFVVSRLSAENLFVFLSFHSAIKLSEHEKVR